MAYITYDYRAVQWTSEDGWYYQNQQTGQRLPWDQLKAQHGPLDENHFDTLIAKQTPVPSEFYSLEDPTGW